MKINQEYIIYYINYETGIPTEKTLQSCLIMLCMVGIPSSILGAYSNITRIILLPFVIIFSFWAIYIMVNREFNKKQFILFLGAFSLFISLLFMIVAYKLALLAYKVTIMQILLIILLYVITNVVNILNVIRLVKKGYYKKKGKNENPIALFIPTSVIGLFMGKLFINADQEIVIAVTVSLSLFLAFFFATGIHNFLKFYYMIKVSDP